MYDFNSLRFTHTVDLVEPIQFIQILNWLNAECLKNEMKMPATNWKCIHSMGKNWIIVAIWRMNGLNECIK